MRRVAVVGAGVGGLATAHALQRAAASGAPIAVRLFEAEARAGGLVRTTREGGWTVEWAANAVQDGEGAAARLAEEVGLGPERVPANAGAARRYVARGGRLHAIPRGPLSLLRFGALSPRGRLRLVLEPILARRVAGDESVHAYATRHLGREAATVLIGAAVRGVYAGDARALSLESAFPIMREMERKHRSLILAMLAGAGPPRRALWSLRGGMESFTEAIARGLEGSIRFRAPVLSLERRAGGEGGYTLALAGGESFEADAVVLAIHPRKAAALLRAFDADAARDLESIPAAGLTVAALGFRADAFRAPPDGYGFLVAPGEPQEILGALFESNLFPERAPHGHVLVRALAGGAERPDLVSRSDEEIVAATMKALDGLVGLKAEPVRTWIVRRPDAIPQYRVGHRDLVARIERRLSRFPGLHVAGNGYRGVAVGKLVEDGEAVARTILGRP